MLPKKIYLNYVDEADEDKTWSEEPISLYDCKMQNREYTDLSSLWHDASEEPNENTDILFIARNGKVHKVSKVDNSLYSFLVDNKDIKRWAYIEDLLPKGGEK